MPSPDVTVTSPDLAQWMASLEAGKAEIVVTSEGSRWSFNNDGGNHYLELVDVTRREPNGRYKRVYKGKITGGHVTHKGVTSDLEPITEYQRWCETPYGRKGREGSREDTRPAGEAERRDALLALQAPRRDGRNDGDAIPFYIH